MVNRKRSRSHDADCSIQHKEWDEASCPICMEHPHNAVLIICSSHEKGCRSYICDTSYRHSNCLDRFKKLISNSSDSPDLNLDSSSMNNLVEIDGVDDLTHSLGYMALAGGPEERTIQPALNMSGSVSKLKCPLCRGSVFGWKVVEEARQYLDLKHRSCSRESCSFFGNYKELRRHARRAHPFARPSEVDPSREQAWRHLENQREYGDIVSAVRSAMPGAVLFGDYAIENEDGLHGEIDRGLGDPNTNNHMLAAFFYMIDSMGPLPERRGTRSRDHVQHHGRRFVWGQNLLGLQNDDSDDDEDPFDLYNYAVEDRSLDRRRRRRLNRYRSDEDRR